MSTVKRTFLCVLIQCFAFFSLAAQEQSFKEAEAAYTAENYDKAIEIYESLLEQYGQSGEVCYNLGNAYYRQGKIAPAILNYERALLLDPGDADARFNLEIAKLKAVDKIDVAGDFFFVRWTNGIQNVFDINTWAVIAIVCFVLLVGALFFFFFAKRRLFKQVAFYTACVLLVFVVCANIFAWNQRRSMMERTDAIVFAATVTIKSSPDASGTDLFVLHEGTKVAVKSTLGEWCEIELTDGNVGWIRRKDIEKI